MKTSKISNVQTLSNGGCDNFTDLSFQYHRCCRSHIAQACRAHLRLISRARAVRSVKPLSSKISKPNQPLAVIKYAQSAIEFIASNRFQAPAQTKRTIYFYADEGLIAESEQAIQVAADASISAAQTLQITTQYIPQPGGLFTTGYLAIKTKSLSGSQAGQTIYAYYHHDHLSTPIRATDKAGNIVWSANYSAFGRAQINTAQTSIVSNLRLPGQYHDEESGLHQNWNRYYDYSVGRYITEDPIGLLGGSNRYIYTFGTPLAYIDPDGRLVWVPIGAVIGGVIGGVVAASSPNANATSIFTGVVTGAIGGALPATSTGYGAVSGLVNYVAENGSSSSVSGAFVAVAFGAAGGRLGSAAGNATFASSAAHFIPGDAFRAAVWAQTGNGVVGTLSGQVGNAVSPGFEAAVGGIGSTARRFFCD
jgi:RHS repeat-associated protein